MTLVLGMVFCALAGTARAFAPNYVWFVALEFIDAMFGAGSYACGFILGVELVGPKYRVLSGTLLSSCYAVGEVLVGVVAWLLQSWRYSKINHVKFIPINIDKCYLSIWTKSYAVFINLFL